mgnify:CR=1 FL=1
MFNKIMLTGKVFDVDYERNTIAISVPSRNETLDFEFAFDEDVVKGVGEVFENEDELLASVEGELISDGEGLAIFPTSISTASLVKKTMYS